MVITCRLILSKSHIISEPSFRTCNSPGRYQELSRFFFFFLNFLLFFHYSSKGSGTGIFKYDITYHIQYWDYKDVALPQPHAALMSCDILFWINEGRRVIRDGARMKWQQPLWSFHLIYGGLKSGNIVIIAQLYLKSRESDSLWSFNRCGNKSAACSFQHLLKVGSYVVFAGGN